MNPKIEVVKMNLQKKGHQTGTFSVKVVIEGGYEVILPGMRVVEGSKGTFVDLPARKFKEVGFVPHYYLNKTLRDLVTDQALEAYEQAIAEKNLDQAGVPADAGKTSRPAFPVAAKPADNLAPGSKPAVTPPHAKSWPKKEWKPSIGKK